MKCPSAREQISSPTSSGYESIDSFECKNEIGNSFEQDEDFKAIEELIENIVSFEEEKVAKSSKTLNTGPVDEISWERGFALLKNKSTDESIKMQLSVPRGDHARLIGHRASKIKKLMEETGTKITFPSPEQQSGQKNFITICGRLENIEHARTKLRSEQQLSAETSCREVCVTGSKESLIECGTMDSKTLVTLQLKLCMKAADIPSEYLEKIRIGTDVIIKFPDEEGEVKNHGTCPVTITGSVEEVNAVNQWLLSLVPVHVSFTVDPDYNMQRIMALALIYEVTVTTLDIPKDKITIKLTAPEGSLANIYKMLNELWAEVGFGTPQAHHLLESSYQQLIEESIRSEQKLFSAYEELCIWEPTDGETMCHHFLPWSN